MLRIIIGHIGRSATAYHLHKMVIISGGSTGTFTALIKYVSSPLQLAFLKLKRRRNTIAIGRSDSGSSAAVMRAVMLLTKSGMYPHIHRP